MATPDLPAPDPEQQVAMVARYVLLDALVERGILDEYIEDQSRRKKVFTAAATLPCNKTDLSEALAQKLLSETPSEIVEYAKTEIRHAGYDPDHPKVGEKFVEWMREHC